MSACTAGWRAWSGTARRGVDCTWRFYLITCNYSDKILRDIRQKDKPESLADDHHDYEVWVDRAQSSGGEVGFIQAEFSDSEVGFGHTRFSGGLVGFASTEFSGGTDSFTRARVSDFEAVPGGTVDFLHANFSGGMVSFDGFECSGGTVDFREAVFPGGTVNFDLASFAGDTADFRNAELSGGTADFFLADGVAPVGLVPSGRPPLPSELSLPPHWYFAGR
ncbi:hypothetical protein OHQ89_51190 [Streptomyces canus]|uniref:hypothetical protein n=1 Tax=Streptomyces canus TaxID=58343 RepID=UPI0030E14BD2